MQGKVDAGAAKGSSHACQGLQCTGSSAFLYCTALRLLPEAANTSTWRGSLSGKFKCAFSDSAEERRQANPVPDEQAATCRSAGAASRVLVRSRRVFSRPGTRILTQRQSAISLHKVFHPELLNTWAESVRLALLVSLPTQVVPSSSLNTLPVSWEHSNLSRAAMFSRTASPSLI